MNHPNIIKLIDCGLVMSKLDDDGTQEIVNYIVLEHLPHGELFDIIAETGGIMENVARYLMMQLFNTVRYLHK